MSGSAALALYVCLQGDDRVASLLIDPDTARLSRLAELPVTGGPWMMTLSPDRGLLHVGTRDTPAIWSFQIDRDSGALELQGRVALDAPPTFLATDRSGRFLLSAHYQGGYVAVHPLDANGAVGAPESDRHETSLGVHAIETDPSNRFAFAPHIGRLNASVPKPRLAGSGPDFIAQFRFDPIYGRLAPSAPDRTGPGGGLGPRHLCFHPSLRLVYSSDQEGSSVTTYRLDPECGTLTPAQTIGTLPEGADPASNTCSEIHLTPCGRFLYVANRGHDSIAWFTVDDTGGLTAAGHAPAEASPTSFTLAPDGRLLFAAGDSSGRVVSYRIDPATGTPFALDSWAVGAKPMAVQAVQLQE